MTLFDPNYLSKFKYQYSMDDLPRFDDEDDRYWRMPDRLRVHATRLESLSPILMKGIRPGGEAGCRIWDDERMPGNLQGTDREQTVLACRMDGVFFWDDYSDGASQGMATVGYKKEGEPVLLITDVSGLSMEPDPEQYEEYETLEMLSKGTDPISSFHRGAVPPERIQCICALKDDMRITTGAVMCPTMHEKEECPLQLDPDSLVEFDDPNNWECFCKLPMEDQ